MYWLYFAHGLESSGICVDNVSLIVMEDSPSHASLKYQVCVVIKVQASLWK